MRRGAWDLNLVAQAFSAFDEDLRKLPPVTLRGGADLDSYNDPTPFDPVADEATDTYIEGYAFAALPHLDGGSWRHYLPYLIRYALRHPDDPAMVTEALVRSLRPPDRFPPRLGSLTEAQEDAVRGFLEQIALSDRNTSSADEARQAIEEWWGPHPRSRPSAAALEAQRAAPLIYRVVSGPDYRLGVPDSMVSSGARDIPSESRRVETWGGYICGDVHAIAAINVLSRPPATFDGTVARYCTFFGINTPAANIDVAGARRAVRIGGVSTAHHPGDPRHVVLVVAEGTNVVLLTIQASVRADVRLVLERIAASFELVTRDAES